MREREKEEERKIIATPNSEGRYLFWGLFELAFGDWVEF